MTEPVSDVLPVATAPLVPAAAEGVAKREEVRVVALAAVPVWDDPAQFEVAGRTVTVVSAALAAAGPRVVAVVLNASTTT